MTPSTSTFSVLGRYRKLAAYIVGTALTYANMYYAHTPSLHYVSAAAAIAGALGVYAVPNDQNPDPAPPPSPSLFINAGRKMTEQDFQRAKDDWEKGYGNSFAPRLEPPPATKWETVATPEGTEASGTS